MTINLDSINNQKNSDCYAFYLRHLFANLADSFMVRPMKLLITGGCGFIGSHLADTCVEFGHDVTILDNLSTGSRANAPAAARLVVGDIADTSLVSNLVADADAVFHLAAIASVEACRQDWLAAHRTNMLGSITVLDAARAKRTPVVYASSAAVYGDNPDLPLAEDAVTNPLSNYGLDKLSLERYAAMAWATYQLPTVGLRFFNVYGPRQDPRSPYSGVISKFMSNAAAGIPLTFFGDGEQTRDFIYVGDVVQLLLSALARVTAPQATGAYVLNGCTGTATSLKQLAASVAETSGVKADTRHEAPRIGDIRHSIGSPTKALQQIGFQAETTIAQGLTRLRQTMHA
jgi:UDP-glucose 4-epimerase